MTTPATPRPLEAKRAEALRIVEGWQVFAKRSDDGCYDVTVDIHLLDTLRAALEASATPPTNERVKTPLKDADALAQHVGTCTLGPVNVYCPMCEMIRYRVRQFDSLRLASATPRPDSEFIAELEWAREEALSSMSACEQEFCVGEAEHKTATDDYARMGRWFDRVLSMLGALPMTPRETP